MPRLHNVRDVLLRKVLGFARNDGREHVWVAKVGVTIGERSEVMLIV